MVKEIEIMDFRIKIQKNLKKIINLSKIKNIIEEKGISEKEFGLCAEPFLNYYNVSYSDPNGVSSLSGHLNSIYIKLNEHSTMKKHIKYSTITINYIDSKYYICCLPQTSYYKKGLSGFINPIVYECDFDDIKNIINKII